MGKRPTPQQVRWQESARERLRLVLERKFDSNQTRLANAMGVSHTLVNLVVRAGQPPTRHLMARVGTIEGVNPRWADTGDGEAFIADTRGTLPVSGVLLPGPPAEHPHLMTGERFAVAPAFDRASCYYCRLPQGHPATTVDPWRLLPGDLLLLETSREVISVPAALTRKMCVLDGRCLGQGEPVYGAVTPDAKERLVFGDGTPRLRFDDLPLTISEPSNAPVPRTRSADKKRWKPINLEKRAKQVAERASDPWYKLPSFDVTHVLAVQLLLVRSW